MNKNRKSKKSVSQVYAWGFPINITLELLINFLSLFIPALFIIQSLQTRNVILFALSILISFYIYQLTILLLGAIATRLIPKPKLGYLNSPKEYLKFQILAALNKFIRRTPARWIILFPFPAHLFYKIAGADIAVSAFQSSPDSIPDVYLVSIGKNTLLGWNCAILGHFSPDSSTTFLGKVDIGENVLIGESVTVWPNVKIGDRSIIQNKSVIRPGTIIPSDEIWGGIPAKKIKSIKKKADFSDSQNSEKIETYIKTLLYKKYSINCEDLDEPLIALGLTAEDISYILNKIQQNYKYLFIDVTLVDIKTFSVADMLSLTIYK